MYNLMQQMLVSGVGMVTAYQDERYVSPVTQELRFHSRLVKFYKLAEYTQRHERYNSRMRILCGCLAEEVRAQDAFKYEDRFLGYGTDLSKEIIKTVDETFKMNIGAFAANPSTAYMEYFRAQAKKIVARAKIMYEGED